MNNEEVAEYIWRKLGPPLLDVYCLIAVIYFVLVGPTSPGITDYSRVGVYSLGPYTEQVGNALFYLGNGILAFRGGLALALYILGSVGKEK